MGEEIANIWVAKQSDWTLFFTELQLSFVTEVS